jgi:hypothetical protein
MASSASRLSNLPLRRRCVAPHDPVGLVGRGGFFLLPIHSHAQVSRITYIQRRAIWYLGVRITCVADLRRFGGAERMVPIATRERFEGGKDVKPTR